MSSAQAMASGLEISSSMSKDLTQESLEIKEGDHTLKTVMPVFMIYTSTMTFVLLTMQYLMDMEEKNVQSSYGITTTIISEKHC